MLLDPNVVDIGGTESVSFINFWSLYQFFVVLAVYCAFGYIICVNQARLLGIPDSFYRLPNWYRVKMRKQEIYIQTGMEVTSQKIRDDDNGGGGGSEKESVSDNKKKV